MALELAADARVEAAAAGLGDGALGHAGEAAHAAHDLVATVGHDLVGKLRVGQQAARHADDVRLARGDDLLHLGGVAQAAERGHGLAHVLFDLCRQVHVAAVVLEHAGVRGGKAKLVAASAHVDEVDIVFELLGDAHTLFEVIAAVEELAAAHAHLDGEAGAALGADGLEDALGQAGAVLEAAAVLVVALVEVGAEELVDEPAVAAMHHAHAEARALGECSGLRVGLDDGVDLLDGEGLDLDAVRAHAVAGAVLAQLALGVLVDHVGAGVLAGMR